MFLEVKMGLEIQVRECGSGDLETFLELARENLEEVLANSLGVSTISIDESDLEIFKDVYFPPETKYKIFFATTDDDCVGYVLCQPVYDNSDLDDCNVLPPSAPVSDKLHLKNFFVSRNFRRRGVFKALVQSIIQYATEQGHKSITSDVELANDPSALAHRSLGFQENISDDYYAFTYRV